jgi:hypothetical protein
MGKVLSMTYGSRAIMGRGRGWVLMGLDVQGGCQPEWGRETPAARDQPDGHPCEYHK